MEVKSTFDCFGSIIVPDDTKIISKDKSLEIYLKGKKKEYLFMHEREGFRGPRRVFYDEKSMIHSPDKDTPAIEEPLIGIKQWFKHGKMHRTDGPAFYTATKEKIYYLEGVECSEELFKLHAASGKLPKPPKLNIAELITEAAKLGNEARVNGSVNGYKISQDEIHELDEASIPSNWEKHGEVERNPDGSITVCLNCEPLDNTLRCYILIDQNNKILQSCLNIE